jgi:hypothetical protein
MKTFGLIAIKLAEQMAAQNHYFIVSFLKIRTFHIYFSVWIKFGKRDLYIMLLRGVVRGGGEWCRRPGQQSPRGGKMSSKINSLNEKC